MTLTPPGILVARTFPGTPDQVGTARRWLEDTLTRTPGRIPDATTATAVLLLSETATNTLRHTASGAPGGTFTVHVHADRHTLAVIVQDAGSATTRPERARTSIEDDHGRGLALVDAFADTWQPLPTGNGISFTLSLTPAPTGTDRAVARTAREHAR
ncbi:ATP-binding protein [Streptomonospora salina]|uniref:Anti-sigma regulatory factor (Ser/Thr protein kinase) n=1 Tax=Streptomonospora salina TaxID=104205 RepID=A0A841EIM6_9ACTN|nr:ATP-binding protein [Streptomonospora salina]MBB6001239.1 anti-sigma regulatory factor (Ser/Thr protein kinase) [Streptomonospora salina]